jgi:hypothetical protein
MKRGFRISTTTSDARNHFELVQDMNQHTLKNDKEINADDKSLEVQKSGKCYHKKKGLTSNSLAIIRQNKSYLLVLKEQAIRTNLMHIKQ